MFFFCRGGAGGLCFVLFGLVFWQFADEMGFLKSLVNIYVNSARLRQHSGASSTSRSIYELGKVTKPFQYQMIGLT